MISYKIEGGKPLNGTVTPMPNKNSIIKIIPACVLADEPVVLHNVPKTSSVRVILNIFKDLGGTVAYLGDNSIRLDSSGINKHEISQKLASKERASFLFLSPLLSRFKKASIGDSGGCKLGNRPLDAMFQGLSDLGVEIDKKKGYSLSADQLRGNEDIWLIEASVTGTETILLAAVKAKGKTVIYNAACEPHTQDLCNFLVSIGAKIKGVGTNKLEIEGVDKLGGGEWAIISDHIDIGGLMVAAAVTGGEMRITNAIPEHMRQVINYFEKLNLRVKIEGDDILIPKGQELKCRLNMKGNIDKIMDQPWPGFPVDLIPQSVVLASVAKGNINIYGVMYEMQLLFVEELLKMKAELTLANSHQVITFGPSNLEGTVVDASSILQCAHALVLAGLASKGTTIIRGVDIIERRYTDLVKKFNKLGANMKKIRT